MSDEKLVTTDQICEHFKVSRNTVNNWRRQGIPFIRNSRKTIRYNMDDVLEWYQRRNEDIPDIEDIAVIKDNSAAVNNLKSTIEETKNSKTLKEEQKTVIISGCSSMLRRIRATQIQFFLEQTIRLEFNFSLLNKEEMGQLVAFSRRNLEDLTDADFYKSFDLILKKLEEE